VIAVNTFVLGDLIFDHLIPVKEKVPPFHPEGGHEKCFDGSRRETIAGGAANSARLAAALSGGRTCLWGLSGHSPWGSFAQILERSQSRDHTIKPIVYHGADSSSHPMNTITRIMEVTGERVSKWLYRIDGVQNTDATHSQADDAISYLEREVCGGRRIDAIILCDHEMGALNRKLIERIGSFATEHGIPLFVDPKRDWEKFDSITVFCSTPNLDQWCAIIQKVAPHAGDYQSEPWWDENLRYAGTRKLFALKSLRHMPNARFHIVKRGQHGAILIAPRTSQVEGALTDSWTIYELPPFNLQGDQPVQIGAGDVLIAAFAIEFIGLQDITDEGSRILRALERANRVVACYLKSEWQRMPSKSNLSQFKNEYPATPEVIEKETILGGVRYLPAAGIHHDLANKSVRGSELVSTDDRFHNIIGALLDDLKLPVPRHAILTAEGGSGKSKFIDVLNRDARTLGYSVWEPPSTSRKSWHNWKSVAKAVDAIAQEWNERKQNASPTPSHLVVVLDEAFKAENCDTLLFGTSGVALLRALLEISVVRLLMIDAGYQDKKPRLNEKEFVDRCREYTLPPLSSRLNDVAYIAAAYCLTTKKAPLLEVSERALLGLINWTLTTGDKNPRSLLDKVEEILAQFPGTGPPLQIHRSHLPDDTKALIGEWDEDENLPKYIRFSWSNRLTPPSGQ
jgi:sugar/nucleoside kinase (ribokinase family)